MKQRSLITLLAVLVMQLASACTLGQAPPMLEPTVEVVSTAGSESLPETEAECKQAGGRWQQLGIIGVGCNLPTTDGGRSCTTLQDCQGLCLAADPKAMAVGDAGVAIPNSEYIETENMSDTEIKGSCSEWQSTFGCIVVVEAGQYQEMCID